MNRPPNSSANSPDEQLQQLVDAIQKRFGRGALRKPGDHHGVNCISTGFPALDRALGIGGTPRGRVTEILGVPTSGAATLALKLIASAQAEGDTAVYVDLARTFDPDYAARCGVDTRVLLLVLGPPPAKALDIAHDLIASGGVGILALDGVGELLEARNGAERLSAGLRRLTPTLSRSPCALLFLSHLTKATPPDQASGSALPHHAALRLLVQRESWLRQRRDVRGYRARVTVLKNKLAPDAGRAMIEVSFDGAVDGDGT